MAAEIRHNKEMAGSEYVTISLSFSPSPPHTWFINYSCYLFDVPVFILSISSLFSSLLPVSPLA